MDSENKSFIQKTENGEQKTDIAIRPLCSVLRLPEVGFPIRKFPDQSLFAAPRDLSQRTTSFIASQRQGIHRTPFWHLIMLGIRKRNAMGDLLPPNACVFQSEKTSFASNTSGIFAVRLRSRLVAKTRKSTADVVERKVSPSSPPRVPLPANRMRFLFTMSICQRTEDR
jgi:hypothetical protein